MTSNLHVKIAGLALLVLAGCSINVKKSDQADNSGEKSKDVTIKSPFGGLHVRTNDVDPKEMGLSVYPGARLKSGSDHDDNANVNISSSMFGLKVVAQKFESDDSPDKVLGFYEKQMGKYGSVISCSGGNMNVRFRRHDKDDPVSCDGHSGHDYDKELKVGTENNQHVVAVKSSSRGSEFTVVYVRAWDNKDTI